MTRALPMNDTGAGLTFLLTPDCWMCRSGEGWLAWDGAAWLPRHDDGAVRVEPARRLPAFENPFAECCRQDWIEKHHRFFAMRIHDEHLQAVGGGRDGDGHQPDACHPVAGMARRGALKQHVRLPATELVARVGRFRFLSVCHGFPFSEEAAA